MTDILLIAPMECPVPGNFQTYRDTKSRTYKQELEYLIPSFNTTFGFRENLGLGCLAALIRQKGYDVKVVSCNIRNLTISETIKVAKKECPKMIGIGILYELHLYNAIRLLFELKRTINAHFCVGGHFATLTHEQLLLNIPQIDSIVVGEGEYTFLELVNSVLNERNWRMVKGVAYRKGNKVILNPRRELINLADLPFPARDSLEFLKKKNQKIPLTSVYTSRGCYGSCTFCTIPRFYKTGCGPKWRYRPPELVVDEIEFLVKEFKVNFIRFNDDNFLGYGDAGKERLVQMAQKILKKKIKVHFHAEWRADNRMADKALLSLLKRAGLRSVFLGACPRTANN